MIWYKTLPVAACLPLLAIASSKKTTLVQFFKGTWWNVAKCMHHVHPNLHKQSNVLPDKLTVTGLINKSHAFYGTQTFIMLSTRASHFIPYFGNFNNISSLDILNDCDEAVNPLCCSTHNRTSWKADISCLYRTLHTVTVFAQVWQWTLCSAT